MRFFSNEAQDDVDGKNDRPADTDPDTTAPVPQQRAGSPWQHDTDTTATPTAVGTSTVVDTANSGDTDTADRTVAFSDDGTPRHSLPDDTAPKHKLPDDVDEPVKDEQLKDESDKDEQIQEKDETEAEGQEADATLDDRDTVDEPHVTPEIDTEPEPVTTPVAATTPAETGALQFFPAADTQPLRDRWRDVQLRFVDDPKGATAEASGLVDEAVDKLSEALREHRGSYAKGTDDTEALRVELRGYRDILDRLLGI
jgi:hypothetical protein